MKTFTVGLIALMVCINPIAASAQQDRPFVPMLPGQSRPNTANNPFNGIPTPPNPNQSFKPLIPPPNTHPYQSSQSPSVSSMPSCPGDKVVWLNLSSHAYHLQGSKYFGNTKRGQYMCEQQAKTQGGHLPNAPNLGR